MNDAELAEKVRDMFEYRDGEMIWRKAPRNHGDLLGKVAGLPHVTQGYIIITLDGKHYKRSRLVWLYHFGRFPVAACDHINHDRQDDRIENLRQLSFADNKRNRKGFNIDMKRRKFRVRLSNKHIGLFNTREEAESAYNKARKEAWGV